MIERIGINGFGRIGRSVFRLLMHEPMLRVVQINDRYDAQTLAHLLKYDSLRGMYPGEVHASGNTLFVDGNEILVSTGRSPDELKWGFMGVNIVLESTGWFNTKQGCFAHVAAGARKVLMSQSPRDEVDTVILPGMDVARSLQYACIVSAGNPTLNSVTLLAKVIDHRFGLVSAHATALYSCSNDQQVHDSLYGCLRRTRAAAHSIIPMSLMIYTLRHLPADLGGKITITGYRVPTHGGCSIQFFARLEHPTTPEKLNDAFREAASENYAEILDYTEDPIVSCDILGDVHPCVVDAGLTKVIDRKLACVGCWFDGEWSYAVHCVALLKKMASSP